MAADPAAIALEEDAASSSGNNTHRTWQAPPWMVDADHTHHRAIQIIIRRTGPHEGGAQLGRVRLDARRFMVFGRDPPGVDANNIFLCHEETISRLHAALVVGAPEHLTPDPKTVPLCIVDLGSTSGTFVDGVRLAPHEPVLLREMSVVHLAGSSREYVMENMGKDFEDEQQEMMELPTEKPKLRRKIKRRATVVADPDLASVLPVDASGDPDLARRRKRRRRRKSTRFSMTTKDQQAIAAARLGRQIEDDTYKQFSKKAGERLESPLSKYKWFRKLREWKLGCYGLCCTSMAVRWRAVMVEQLELEMDEEELELVMKILDLIVNQRDYTLRDFFTFASTGAICDMELTRGVVEWAVTGFLQSTLEYLDPIRVLQAMQRFVGGVCDAYKEAYSAAVAAGSDKAAKHRLGGLHDQCVPLRLPRTSGKNGAEAKEGEDEDEDDGAPVIKWVGEHLQHRGSARTLYLNIKHRFLEHLPAPPELSWDDPFGDLLEVPISEQVYVYPIFFRWGMQCLEELYRDVLTPDICDGGRRTSWLDDGKVLADFLQAQGIDLQHEDLASSTPYFSGFGGKLLTTGNNDTGESNVVPSLGHMVTGHWKDDPDFSFSAIDDFCSSWEDSMALEAQQCIRSRYYHLMCEARRELVYITEIRRFKLSIEAKSMALLVTIGISCGQAFVTWVTATLFASSDSSSSSTVAAAATGSGNATSGRRLGGGGGGGGDILASSSPSIGFGSTSSSSFSAAADAAIQTSGDVLFVGLLVGVALVLIPALVHLLTFLATIFPSLLLLWGGVFSSPTSTRHAARQRRGICGCGSASRHRHRRYRRRAKRAISLLSFGDSGDRKGKGNGCGDDDDDVYDFRGQGRRHATTAATAVSALADARRKKEERQIVPTTGDVNDAGQQQQRRRRQDEATVWQAKAEWDAEAADDAGQTNGMVVLSLEAGAVYHETGQVAPLASWRWVTRRSNDPSKERSGYAPASFLRRFKPPSAPVCGVV